MDNLSDEEIQLIWDNLPDQSWYGLAKWLANNKSGEGISAINSEVVNQLTAAAERLNERGISFPGTVTEFAESLRQEIG